MGSWHGLIVAHLVLGAISIANAPAARAASATLPMADVATRCAAVTQGRDTWDSLADGDVCRVVASGQVPGATPPVFFQLQAYGPPGPGPGPASGQDDPAGAADDGAGAVLLTPSPDGRTLTVFAGWSGSGASVEPPGVVRTRQGPILVLPMGTTVSSHPNEDAVFRRSGGRWVEVSTTGWWAGVRVPRGVRQRHGNAMDWPSLRAFGAFWKPGDAECCATGGSYIARLRLDGTRLRLAGIRYSRGLLPFP